MQTNCRTPQINDSRYDARFKAHKTNGALHLFSHSESVQRAYMRRAFPDMTKQDHIDARDYFNKVWRETKDVCHATIRIAEEDLCARGLEPGPLISGIISDNFGPAAKSYLSALCARMNLARDIAHCHHIASMYYRAK